tara:strand:- start:1352 stop:1516 length:165 start_codon:yes stop_codon:yes gene_type:complete
MKPVSLKKCYDYLDKFPDRTNEWIMAIELVNDLDVDPGEALNIVKDWKWENIMR